MPKTQEDYVNQLRDDLSRMQRRIVELERQLSNAIRGKMPEFEQIDPDMIWVESMVSAQTKEPYVVFRWFTHLAHLPVESARKIAIDLLEAVEGAKTDSYIFKLLGGETEEADQRAAHVVLMLRNLRDAEKA